MSMVGPIGANDPSKLESGAQSGRAQVGTRSGGNGLRADGPNLTKASAVLWFPVMSSEYSRKQ